jgi:hypothetical protein
MTEAVMSHPTCKQQRLLVEIGETGRIEVARAALPLAG